MMPGTDDPPPRCGGQGPVAFVLSGGCNLGAVQVGMLRALFEQGVRPDLVIGCSVGALNGAALAEDPSLTGIARLERTWLGLDGRALLPRGRLPHAVALARRGEAIHPGSGIRQLLARTLVARRFEDLEVPFECVATDVEDVSERWFGRGPLLDAVMASSAMPALLPSVEVRGRRYLDGGVVNDVPVDRAVQRGARTLYVLEVGSLARARSVPRRPLDTALLACQIARSHRFKAQLDALPGDVEVHLMPRGPVPARPPLRFDDFTRSGELIRGAYEASCTYLAQVAVAVPGTA